MAKPAQLKLEEAMALEGEAHRLLVADDEAAARPLLLRAAALYRESWEEAPPTAFGRLVGMLKAAILAGDGGEQAAYVRSQLPAGDSPTSAYALAIASALEGDDDAVRRHAAVARDGGEAFERAAEALDALAADDAARHAAAVAAIHEDFARRSEHLTGVAIADTALMLEALAARRGLS